METEELHIAPEHLEAAAAGMEMDDDDMGASAAVDADKPEFPALTAAEMAVCRAAQCSSASQRRGGGVGGG